MHLLPPSPKPFGVFVERTPSTLLEEDLAIAFELERQIVMAALEKLLEKVRFDLWTKDGRTYQYTAPLPLEYIYITLDVR